MILKFKQNEEWIIVDNIEQVDLLPFEEGHYFEGAVAAAMLHKKGGGSETRAFADDAFLMNDDGKTIQRITRRVNDKYVGTL